jgi:hypothetical protein
MGQNTVDRALKNNNWKVQRPGAIESEIKQDKYSIYAETPNGRCHSTWFGSQLGVFGQAMAWFCLNNN